MASVDAASFRDFLRSGIIFGVLAGLCLYIAVTLLLALQMFPSPWGGGTLTRRSFVFGIIGDFFATHPGAVGRVGPGITDGGFLPAAVYYVVGGVIIAGAGFKTASATTPGTPTGAIGSGGAIVVGYFPIVVGSLVAIWQLDPHWVSLNPLRALGMAGVVIPLLYGALGGFLWMALRAYRDDDRSVLATVRSDR